MKNMIEAACVCDIGRLRKNNEDNLYFNGKTLDEVHFGLKDVQFKQFCQEAVCFGIFDGMGGMQDGQVASNMAAKSFQSDCQFVEHGGMMSEAFFISAITHMNDKVSIEAERRKNNMGTTAVLLGFCDNQIYICNVGDSRAYRYRNGKFTQISIDHVVSTPPYMLDGKHGKPGLSQCIGLSPDEIQIEPYVAKGITQSEDLFLICSDGLTDMVSDFEISGVLASGRDMGVCAKQLLDLAIAHGGKDNITIIVVHIKGTSGEV